MPFWVFCLLLFLQMPFPGPRAGADTRRADVDQSWIAGQVRTQGGDPVPVALISVRMRTDAAGSGSRADQRQANMGWPGAEARVKADGSFRIAVPGASTYEVCAEAPAKPKQCKSVEVSPNDLEVVEFAF